MKSKAEIKRIGVLTSGGDAPGMNAAVRAVTRTAAAMGIGCLGIRRGYNGLINGDVVELGSRSVDGIMRLGGTMLYTARCEEFLGPDGQKKAADTCRYLGIDCLAAIGGDGTFRGLLDLSKLGIKTVGIPGTIDNDIPCTEYTIGFDTAMNTALDAIDKLRDTMQSHERCSVVEVMGHRSGNLALNVGIACGATAIIVPEKNVDLEQELLEKIRTARIHEKNHHMIIAAEGVNKMDEIVRFIKHSAGIDVRATVLGHVQRGGSPSARDRIMATQMGSYAVECVASGKSMRVVCVRGGKICDLDISEALKMEWRFDEALYESSKIVSI